MCGERGDADYPGNTRVSRTGWDKVVPGGIVLFSKA